MTNGRFSRTRTIFGIIKGFIEEDGNGVRHGHLTFRAVLNPNVKCRSLTPLEFSGVDRNYVSAGTDFPSIPPYHAATKSHPQLIASPLGNGGAWLTIGGQRVDFIYHRLEPVERISARQCA